MKIRKIGRKTIGFILMLLLGVAMFYLLVFILSPYSSLSIYPAAILKIYVGLLALVYMDRIHHAEINTTQAILNRNMAYGLIMVAYAIIIAAVLGSI